MQQSSPGVHMLDGLNAVPWSQLKDARGSGEEIPALMSRVTSGSTAERREALKALRERLWNNGQIFEATPRAVPFLIELLQEPSTAADVALLLGLISESLYAGPQESKELATAAHTAVRAGLPIYLEQLRRAERGTALSDALIYLGFHLYEDRKTLIPLFAPIMRQGQEFMIQTALAPETPIPDTFMVWGFLGAQALNTIES